MSHDQSLLPPDNVGYENFSCTDSNFDKLIRENNQFSQALLCLSLGVMFSKLRQTVFLAGLFTNRRSHAGERRTRNENHEELKSLGGVDDAGIIGRWSGKFRYREAILPGDDFGEQAHDDGQGEHEGQI